MTCFTKLFSNLENTKFCAVRDVMFSPHSERGSFSSHWSEPIMIDMALTFENRKPTMCDKKCDQKLLKSF